MPLFKSHGTRLYYEEHGSGRPLLFSHGLGGHMEQVLPLVEGLPGARILLYDNRTHGRSPEAGDPGTLTFPGMADDAAALLKHLEIGQAVVGGVSMGAGVALALALRHPKLASALILSRPAWLDRSVPPNLGIFPRIADLIERFGVEGARAELAESPVFAHYVRTSPATAASLLGLFEGRSEAALIASFRFIPASSPCSSLAELGEVGVPALVVGNHNDPIHPFSMAEALKAALPDAKLVTVISKSEDWAEHHRQFRDAVASFLRNLEVS